MNWYLLPLGSKEMPAKFIKTITIFSIGNAPEVVRIARRDRKRNRLWVSSVKGE